jgi:hypothetical protein
MKTIGRAAQWRTVVLAASACVAGAVFARPAAPSPQDSAVAEAIYRQGVLPSGQPLIGRREGGIAVAGAAGACVNCHRRSGLGTFEGRTVVPPITGRYLFRPGGRHRQDANWTAQARASLEDTVPDRGPYTDATLARAIREGVAADGRSLDFLMPRYDLDEATMASLTGYLRHLSRGPVPGATGETLEFATIVTPDADPVERQGMLDVLQHYFDSKNGFYRGKDPPIQTQRRIMFRVVRRWNLHVWELTGPPETWEQQLHAKLRAEPVFAVISGIGRTTWEPVHRFCQSAAIPCLLPNIDLPVTVESDFYPVYFSRGVLLEADLVAHQLQAAGRSPDRHQLVQVYREDDIGAQAARALAKSAPDGLAMVQRVLKANTGPHPVSDALKDIGAGDIVVLWLRPPDLQALPAGPGNVGQVFVSGLMGGLEKAPLPTMWRALAAMTYPYDLPGNRAVRMNYPLGWFQIQQIPVVAERVQTDTYIACTILAEASGHMLDNFVRDYLVELVEEQLSERLVNGYFSRLGLAPGQRFASKGGYLVRLADAAGGPRIVAESSWIVP